jgi:hypothetical protein
MAPKRNGKAIGEVVPGDMRSKLGVRRPKSGVGSLQVALLIGLVRLHSSAYLRVNWLL